jgi:hypothetical protein
MHTKFWLEQQGKESLGFDKESFKKLSAFLDVMIHYCGHERKPLGPILSQINPLHTLAP